MRVSDPKPAWPRSIHCAEAGTSTTLFWSIHRCEAIRKAPRSARASACTMRVQHRVWLFIESDTARNLTWDSAGISQCQNQGSAGIPTRSTAWEWNPDATLYLRNDAGAQRAHDPRPWAPNFEPSLLASRQACPSMKGPASLSGNSPDDSMLGEIPDTAWLKEDTMCRYGRHGFHRPAGARKGLER